MTDKEVRALTLKVNRLTEILEASTERQKKTVLQIKELSKQIQETRHNLYKIMNINTNYNNTLLS